MKPRWQPEEIDYVRRSVGRQPLRTIARKLKRTPIAVEQQIIKGQRTSPHALAVGKDMTSPEIAAALGIARSIVIRWLASGALPSRRVVLRKRVIHAVKRTDLREFILRGGMIDNVANPRPEWRAAVLDGARLWHERYVSSNELADLLGMARINFSAHLRHAKHFPRPAHTGGRAPAYFDRTAVRAWLDAHPQYWTSAARASL